MTNALVRTTAKIIPFPRRRVVPVDSLELLIQYIHASPEQRLALMLAWLESCPK